MLGAFLTGFVGGVAKQIEEQSERIEEDTRALIARRAKEKAEAEAKAEEKRDEIKQQYKALKTVIPGLTEAQAVGIINSGTAGTVVKMGLEKSLSQEETARLFKVAKGQEDLRFDDYLTKATTLTRGAPIESEMLPKQDVMGLKLTAGEKALQSGIARTGYTKEQLESTRLGKPMDVEGALDVSVFADPKKLPTKEARLAEFAEQIVAAQAAGDQAGYKELIQQRDRYVAAFPKADKEDALSFSNRTFLITNAVKTAVEKNTAKLGNATFNIDPETGKYNFRGNAEQNKVFNDIKVEAARTFGLRLADKQGRVDAKTAMILESFGVPIDTSGRILKAAPAPDAAPAPTPPKQQNVTTDALRDATARAIKANPNNKANFIAEFERATGQKY